MGKRRSRHASLAAVLLSTLIVLTFSASALGRPTVLVLSQEPEPPAAGLVESLEIQLASLAMVHVGSLLAAATLDARMAQAAELRSAA